MCDVQQQVFVVILASTYLASTCLVANWGIPLAALADMQRDPDIISPRMTAGMYGVVQ